MKCPVCDVSSIEPLVHLPNYPIYQHPVERDADMQAPFHVDLDYQICAECNHGFHLCADRDLLEKIYSSNYFTKPAEGVGTAIFDSFQDFVRANKAAVASESDSPSVLEIASSFGEALLFLKEVFPASELEGFEPHQHAAEEAEQAGFQVHKQFFNPDTAAGVGKKYDLVLARHLIEHIFDLDAFVDAIGEATHDSSKVMIETPCLDWTVNTRSMIGLCIEHVQFFSERSLQELFLRKGWHLETKQQTPEGNMILLFSRTAVDPAWPTKLDAKSFHDTYTQFASKIRDFVGDQDFLIWGAGSAGNIIRSLMPRAPLAIVDGNIHKTGKMFAGLDIPIQFVKDDIQSFNNGTNKLIVASLFVDEISQELQQIGWKGDPLFPLAHDD